MWDLSSPGVGLIHIVARIACDENQIRTRGGHGECIDVIYDI